MIKIICFDLDGVYFSSEGKKGFQEELSILSGKNDEVQNFLTKSIEMRELGLGKLSDHDFLATLNNTLDISLNLDQLSELRSKHYVIDQGIQDLILQLKYNGYKIGVCTNNNAIRIQSLEKKFNFLKDFDVFVSSHECGYYKPSKEIFMKFIEMSGYNASEIVYSDDNVDRLSGARDSGMKVYKYDNLQGYLKYLLGEGVKLK